MPSRLKLVFTTGCCTFARRLRARERAAHRTQTSRVDCPHDRSADSCPYDALVELDRRNPEAPHYASLMACPIQLSTEFCLVRLHGAHALLGRDAFRIRPATLRTTARFGRYCLAIHPQPILELFPPSRGTPPCAQLGLGFRGGTETYDRKFVEGAK